MNQYLISAIIPSRNRQKYAEAAVRHILTVSDAIQIVIHDNSDSDILADRLSDVINLPQVEYKYIKNKIPSIDNYNLATSFATGEYLIALGDDDTLLPNIVSCAKWMKKNSFDAIKTFRKISYRWPDLKSKNPLFRYGYLSYYNFNTHSRELNLKQGIFELLKNGGQNYFDKDLVGSYHCLVRRECMEQVKGMTGRFYGGLSPDMYSLASLSVLEGIKAVEVGFPISLPGVCPVSTSADGKNSDNFGDLSKAPHLEGFKIPYKWDKRVPRFYAHETIWAETLLKALTLMGKESYIDKYYDSKKLAYHLYMNHPKYRKEILAYLNKEEINGLKFMILEQDKRKNRNVATWNKLREMIKGKEHFKPMCENITKAVAYIESTKDMKAIKRYLEKNIL